MGCKCVGKYWKQARLPLSIYGLKNALPGTLSDPKKRTMPLLSFLNSNELLSSASANIYMTDPTDPWAICLSIWCWLSPEISDYQVSGNLPLTCLQAEWQRCPLFWLSPTFTPSHLPKWPQRGSSLSSLSSESSRGCICSVDIIKGEQVCGFLFQHHKV